ncbi:MAG TPA: acyl-CoA dehydrogenase [Myxococcales bacterium]|nr:acyl-CoA dehydrogenase [Myxococcales bacterium]
MDFTLSDTQREFQASARKFTQAMVIPNAAHHDETAEYPLEILKTAWELGLMNLHIPEEFGGLGLSSLDSTIINEEVAAGCSGICTAMSSNILAEQPILVGGSEALKKEILGPMTEEFQLAAYCVTEPGAGSDVAGLRTRAEKQGDAYVINGEKMWITNASVASWYFVLAKTDPDGGHKGMTGFVVPADTPGITVGKKEQNMGQRCSDTRGIRFENVVVPERYRLGAEGKGWLIAMNAFDHTRPMIASMAVGVARAAMNYAKEYALERKTFGKVIAKHQAVAFMIAEMNRDVEAARLLPWRAAWLADQGKPATRSASVAKLFAADSCMRICTDAVQVFGGYGFSKEFPVEKLMRDAKIFQIYEGTSQIQRLIISREFFSGNS